MKAGTILREILFHWVFHFAVSFAVSLSVSLSVSVGALISVGAWTPWPDAAVRRAESVSASPSGERFSVGLDGGG